LFRVKIGSLNTDIFDYINWKPENKYDFFYNISLSNQDSQLSDIFSNKWKRYIGDKIPFEPNESIILSRLSNFRCFFGDETGGKQWIQWANLMLTCVL